jgi:hypothetical protein
MVFSPNPFVAQGNYLLGIIVICLRNNSLARLGLGRKPEFFKVPNMRGRMAMKSFLKSLAIVLVMAAVSAMADLYVEPVVFEATYYADQNRDVREKTGYDAAKLVQHWRRFGLKEGRKSSPVFDVRYYLKHNPDLARTFGEDNYAEAAQHWFQTGRLEGRPSHPDFQVKRYLQLNADVARQYGEYNYVEAIDHYLRTGYQEGRQAK